MVLCFYIKQNNGLFLQMKMFHLCPSTLKYFIQATYLKEKVTAIIALLKYLYT